VPPGVPEAVGPLINDGTVGDGGRCAVPAGGANAPAIPHGTVAQLDIDEEEGGATTAVGVVAAMWSATACTVALATAFSIVGYASAIAACPTATFAAC